MWQAAEVAPSAFGCFVQFLLLTAFRRNEAARMRRQEVVGDDWIIPQERYKTGKELVIPLSAAVAAVLAKVPHIGEAGFVFTTSGKTPISGFSKFKQALDKVSGSTGWTIARLRRTARILMCRAGVPSRPCRTCVGSCHRWHSLDL